MKSCILRSVIIITALLTTLVLSSIAVSATHTGRRDSLAGFSQPLHIAMTAAFVSETGIHIYEEIAAYLEKKLKREVLFVSGLSYGTVNEMIDQNVVKMAFVCGLPYTLKHDMPEPAVRLLAAPVMRAPRYQDRPIYYSDIIVRKDSPFRRFEDLRGAVFVFNDEISNSGYNMPRAHLVSLKETKGFFGKLLRSGSHEESIRMVARGKAQTSAVDSLVLDYERQHNPELVSQVRVIESLGPSAIPPVVVSTAMPEKEFLQIQAILLEMADDPKGKEILDAAAVKRFEKVTDDFYDGIRAMRKMAEEAGFNQIR